MPSRTNVPISGYILPTTKAKIVALAKKQDSSIAKTAADILERYFAGEEEVFRVLLKIPAKLKGDKDGLTAWLNQKIAAITAQLCQ